MLRERQLVAETKIEVNNYDIDAMGIVSNIVYVRWFEDLRTIFVNQHLSISEMLKRGISPILMHTEIDYKIPITIHDQPIGRCWLTKVSRMKWVFEFEISTGDQIHCRGMQYGGFYHLAQQRVVPVPDEFKII